MCNRAGSLIANVIESYGIPTICLSINREMSEAVRAPRAGFVKFPYGAPFGEPGQPRQELKILYDLFALLRRAPAHGTLEDLPHQWRRTQYDEIPPAAFAVL
jgi:hypothetical protein